MQTTINNYIKLVPTFLKTDFAIALAITIIWKLSITLLGFIVDNQINHAPNLLAHTVRWDSNWYLIVTNDHYFTNPVSPVFYPLFPFLVSFINFISFNQIDYIMCSQIINTLSVWLAIAALIKIGKVLFEPTKKYWLIGLILSAPAAFFLHAFYTEALFLALSSWAYLFALRRDWLKMSILLAILTACRLPAILIIFLCGLEYLSSYKWDIKKALNKNIFYFALAPIGFIAYSIYLGFARHDLLAMFHGYKETTDWVYQIFNPNIFFTIAREFYQIIRAILGLRPFDNDALVNHTIPVIMVLLLIVTSIYLIKKGKKYLPLGIYGLASVIMFTINSNVVSAHRYILPCLTFYAAIILFVKRKTTLLIICSLSIIVQLVLFVKFILYDFAG